MKNKLNIFTIWLLFAATVFSQTANVTKVPNDPNQVTSTENNLKEPLNTGTQTITANDGGTITYSGTGTLNAKTLQTYTPATLPVSTATQTALDARLEKTRAQIFTPSANTEAAILSAYAEAVAAGGGTILLPSATITLTAPLPIASNICYKGVPSDFVYPDGADGVSFEVPTGDGHGTILRGDGTFNGIEGNASDSTYIYHSYPNLYTKDAITNCSIEDLTFYNFRTAVKIGGRNHEGAIYSRFTNLYAVQCDDWGFVFKNYIHNVYQGLFAMGCVNGMLFEMDIPGEAQGNSDHRTLLSTIRLGDPTDNRKGRGIVFRCRNESNWGTLQVVGLQSNRFGAERLGGCSRPLGNGVSVTTTAASKNIGVPDGDEFAVDMPVFFASGSDSAFTTNKTYFVTSVSGDTIQVSLSQKGAPIAAINGAGGILKTNGFPCMEIVGIMSHDTVDAQTPAANVLTFSGTGNNPDFVPGQGVLITTTGTTPGITSDGATEYYVIPVSANQYKLATSKDNAFAGTAVTLSGAWTGTATVTSSATPYSSDIIGVDLEGGGSIGLYVQNAQKVGFIGNSLSESGVSALAPDWAYTFVGRGCRTSSFNTTRYYATDFDTSDNWFFGDRNYADTVGAVGYGLASANANSFSTAVLNLNEKATTQSDATLQRIDFGNGANAHRMNVGLIDNHVLTSDTANFPSGQIGAISFIGANNGAWTLPTIFDTDFNHTVVGQHYEITNATPFKLVLTPASGQIFNDRFSTLSIGGFQTCRITAMKKSGGGFYWAATAQSQPRQKDVAYAASTTIDLAQGTVQEIANITGNLSLTINNIPHQGTPVTLMFVLDSFASGTRNITFPASCKFAVPFLQPTAGVNTTARCTVHFVVGSNGNLIATGPNMWDNGASGLTASQISNVAAGSIAATTVQAALNELDTEKAGTATANTFTAAQTFGTGGTSIARIKHGTATLVAGTVTVSDATTTANTRIFVNRFTDGGTRGASYSVTRSAGASFTITSYDGAGAAQTADTSVVAYQMIEP